MAKNAILKAKISGALYEILVKTSAANVMVDDNTTLAAKLAEIVASVATKASSEEMATALAGKAEKVHTHATADVTGLDDALAARPLATAVTAEINAAIDGLIDGAPETYNTLKEVATYISEHEDVVTALNEAIGQKADKTAFEALQASVEALGAVAKLDIVTEEYLSEELREKINAASDGNHSHLNKELLDTYTQTEADLADAVAKKHNHENKTVLDGITADRAAAWDGKATIYYQSTEPANMAEGDLWVQIVE